jgi:hypothetical protein
VKLTLPYGERGLDVEVPDDANVLRPERTPPLADPDASTRAMVQARCHVWLHSSLPRETAEAAHLRYAPDVADTLAQIIDEKRAAIGHEPTVCVLPYGQLTVPKETP